MSASHPGPWITTLTADSIETLRAHATTTLGSGSCGAAGIGFAATDAAGEQVRLIAQAATVDELASALGSFVAGNPAPGVHIGKCTTPPDVAFVFAGQSETRIGMGGELFPTNRAFSTAIERCSDVVNTRLGTSLVDVLYGEADPSLIGDARFAQPALFALQSGLLALWRSWGVEPAAVAGHSLGEYAAAHAASVMTIEDGAGLVARRGELTQALAAPGEMAVVFADEAAVAEHLTSDGSISLAAINAPEVVVVSGPIEDIETCVADLKRRDITAKPLRISHAFHSICIEPMLDPLEHAAAQTPMDDAKLPFVSTLEGRLIEAGGLREPRYWRRHAREPVRFLEAVRALRQSGCSVFLEVGPHATLTSLGERCLPNDADARWLPSLKRSGDDFAVLAQTASALWLGGAKVEMTRMAADVGWQHIEPSRIGATSTT